MEAKADKNKSTKQSTAGLIRALLVSACFSVTVGCAARPAVPVGEVPLASRPEPTKVQETKAMVEQNLSQEGYKLYTSGKDYERVRGIITRLVIAAGADGFNYPVYVADANGDVNAMAVNSTTIVVYKELLKKVPNDDELATVLSHEVAHILAKHSEDESTQSRADAVSIGSQILGVAATVGATVAGAGAGAADMMGDVTSAAAGVVGEGALVRAYDRQLEYEADHIGLMLMGKAGYNPEAAVRFWGRANEIFGDSNGISFLSTHPSGDDRMSSLREAMPKALEYYRVATVPKLGKKDLAR